MENLILW